ncbi:hypothetical protein Pfo_025300 [Paulownia fortunei]|nr:hypothetical protein Pfo_025300 [Paulownia fortunei]
MERTKPPKIAKQSSEVTNHVIWDCGSSLYDSFELKALEKLLESAIASRTLSMPHLSDRRLPPPPLRKKTTSSISCSFRRFISAVFRPKNRSITNNDAIFGGGFVYERSKEGFYVVYDRSPALSTIQEVSGFDGLSPKMRSLLRRTASDPLLPVL